VIGFGELALTANYGTSETGVKRWEQEWWHVASNDLGTDNAYNVRRPFDNFQTQNCLLLSTY